MKKSMDTVYSLCIQGTISKFVVNIISCSLFSVRLQLTRRCCRSVV